MGKIKLIRISTEKKKPKEIKDKVFLREGHGIEGDIHSGKGERQISILTSDTKREIHKSKGDGFCTIKFDENIECRDIELFNYNVGDRFKVGESTIELTEIGKKCYGECPLIKDNNKCKLSKECIFAKVVCSGWVKTEDEICKV